MKATQSKNKILQLMALVLSAVFIFGFTPKAFVMDGGAISNERIFVTPGTIPLAIGSIL